MWSVLAALLGVVGPAFAVVAAGWLLTRTLRPPGAWIRATQRLTFDLLIPLMLFGIAARVQLPESPPWALLAAYYLPTAALFLAAAVANRRRGLTTATLFGFSATYSNVVLLGIPVALAAFGDAGALALFVIVSVNAPLLFTALALGAATPADGHPLRVLAQRTLGNPILLALLLGAAVNLAGFGLWPPIDSVLGTLRNVTPVVALLVMGAGLAGQPLGGSAREAATLTVLKLFVHPLLVWLATVLLGVTGVEQGVLVLLAAMPVGINVWLMALRYQTLESQAAAAVLHSTAAALITLTLLVTLLAPVPA